MRTPLTPVNARWGWARIAVLAGLWIITSPIAKPTERDRFRRYYVQPPPRSLIPTNPRVVFHVAGEVVDYIPGLGNLHPEFVSDQEVVPARVVSEVALADAGLAETVLEPAHRLRPFAHYALRLREAPPDAPPSPFYPSGAVRDLVHGGIADLPIEWTTEGGPDETRPHWRGVPRVLTKDQRAPFKSDVEFRYHSTPDPAMIDVDASDDSDHLMVRFEIKEGAAWKRSLSLPVHGRLVVYDAEYGWFLSPSVGGGHFRRPLKTTVRLVLVDVAGNESVPSGEFELRWE